MHLHTHTMVYNLWMLLTPPTTQTRVLQPLWQVGLLLLVTITTTYFALNHKMPPLCIHSGGYIFLIKNTWIYKLGDMTNTWVSSALCRLFWSRHEELVFLQERGKSVNAMLVNNLTPWRISATQRPSGIRCAWTSIKHSTAIAHISSATTLFGT